MAQDMSAGPRVPEKKVPHQEEAVHATPETPTQTPERVVIADTTEISELSTVRKELEDTSQQALRSELTAPEKAASLSQAHARIAEATTDEARIAELLEIAHSHGLNEAKKLAEKTKNAHVIDAVHDQFVNEQENEKGGR